MRNFAAIATVLQARWPIACSVALVFAFSVSDARAGVYALSDVVISDITISGATVEQSQPPGQITSTANQAGFSPTVNTAGIFDAPQATAGVGPFPPENSFVAQGLVGSYGRADSLITNSSISSISEIYVPPSNIHPSFAAQTAQSSAQEALSFTQTAGQPVTISFHIAIDVQNQVTNDPNSLSELGNLHGVGGTVSLFTLGSNGFINATILDWFPGESVPEDPSLDYRAGAGIDALGEAVPFEPNSVFSNNLLNEGDFSITFTSNQDITYYGLIEAQTIAAGRIQNFPVPEPGSLKILLTGVLSFLILVALSRQTNHP